MRRRTEGRYSRCSIRTYVDVLWRWSHALRCYEWRSARKYATWYLSFTQPLLAASGRRGSRPYLSVDATAPQGGLEDLGRGGTCRRDSLSPVDCTDENYCSGIYVLKVCVLYHVVLDNSYVGCLKHALWRLIKHSRCQGWLHQFCLRRPEGVAHVTFAGARGSVERRLTQTRRKDAWNARPEKVGGKGVTRSEP